MCVTTLCVNICVCDSLTHPTRAEGIVGVGVMDGDGGEDVRTSTTVSSSTQ